MSDTKFAPKRGFPNRIDDSVQSGADETSDTYDSLKEGSTPPDLVLIGGNCHVKGEIRNCKRLEIEGRLEGDFETEEIIVKVGGNINGKLKTTKAEVFGTIEGELVVKDLLNIHETGKVAGDVDYGKLAVATGGQLSGSLKNQHSKSKSNGNVSASKDPIGSGTSSSGGFSATSAPAKK